ncbi:MAG: hydroxyethylthiazole kinase [Beijerinckiaceae bacterium]
MPMKPNQSPALLSPEVNEILARIAVRRPRIQCLTNTVAQNITANALLAIGADVSMAQHPAEIVTMSASADALLINLGTMDAAREAAIEALLRTEITFKGPVVIDPVFADRSPLRLDLAKRLLRLPRVILKGNASEMAILALLGDPGVIRVTTGAVDEVYGPSGTSSIASGHPLMARVTATGCVAGAIIAAFASVTEDPAKAAVAALTCFGLAGEEAARRSSGPGSFLVHLLDVLAGFSDQAVQIKALSNA